MMSSRRGGASAAGLLLLFSGGLVGAGGCGPIIEEAPFHIRPDTVEPGDLLGPYDGRVLDGDTDKPVGGALVYASWTFERGVGLVGPAGAVVRTAETDLDGTYHLPRLGDLPGGLSSRVESFTLVVYKRGFIGYRSDRFFRDGARRADFAQHGNRVRLERFTEELSHARHLAFLGGAPPVRRAASWEVELASLELDGQRRPGRGRALAEAHPLPPPPPLDAWPLLRVDEVKATTGFGGAFQEERLTDLPRTSFYDSHHFRATGQAERFDVAVRVWRLPAKEAQAQYQKLLETLPGAKTADEIGTQSLRAGQTDILALAWYDGPHGVVAQISCGRGQCSDLSMVRKLADIVQHRLDLLGGPAAKVPPPGEAGKTLEQDVGASAPAPASPPPAGVTPAPPVKPAKPETPQSPPTRDEPLKLKPPEAPR